MSSQPGNKNDLDGSAPDSNPVALLLIDVINDFEYPGGEQLFEKAKDIAPKIRELKRRARAAKVPAIYVNDNFGRWRSSLEQLFQRCMDSDVRGRPFVEQLAPAPEDYFVLKPKNSGFYQTPLDVLLKHLGTKKLILTGLCTNSCVLFTAHDAYMRDLELFVPSDCVATQTHEQQHYALEQMRTVTKADIRPSAEIDFEAVTKNTEATKLD